MLRKVAFMACLAGAVALALACGDDDNTNTKQDKGSGIKLDSGGGAKLDKGGSTKKDGGGGGADMMKINDCLDIMSCVSKCNSGDQTCSQKCISAAPAAEQTKFNNYMTCANKALQGTCATACKDQASAACKTCIQTNCKTEIDACQGTGGPAVAGFGDVCDLQGTNTCKTGLTCVGAQGVGTAGKGWCSKTCPAASSGKPCAGAPTGTQAFCALKESATKYWCLFACKLSTSTWKCPSTMKCGTLTNGQALCEP